VESQSQSTLWDSRQSDRSGRSAGSGRLSERQAAATARPATLEQQRELLRTYHPLSVHQDNGSDVVLVVNKAAKPRRRGTATPENAISTAQPLSDAPA